MAEFFSYFAFAQMIMCALILFPLWKKNQSVALYILLMVSGCGYLLGEIFTPVVEYSLVWWFEVIGGNALPGMFWLVSLSVFGDHVVLKRWQYYLASLTLVIPLTIKILSSLSVIHLTSYPTLSIVIKYSSMTLELSLIYHALLVAFQHWRDDLVQERRYIRGGVISISALYIFLVIVLEQLFDLQWQGLDILKAGSLALLVTGINVLLFNLRPSSLFETVIQPEKADNNIIENQPSKELLRIIEAMTKEKIYQQEGITIASLAKHLSIHEYKLRHLINGEMNYRNFNDFLNYYRIKEITEKLELVELSSTPVLTLALESGFRSLSSFNKVFKSTHNVTPTEYRKKVLAKAV
jgi:AraC-like DNA-binding protein